MPPATLQVRKPISMCAARAGRAVTPGGGKQAGSRSQTQMQCSNDRPDACEKFPVVSFAVLRSIPRAGKAAIGSGAFRQSHNEKVNARHALRAPFCTPVVRAAVQPEILSLMKTFLRYSDRRHRPFRRLRLAQQHLAVLHPAAAGAPVLLAHRGLAQTYTREDLERDTCTATRINPPEHEFIENTLPSMEAAFAAGADVVEFDVHPTTDGNFAVFHDWTLGCRTEGNGTTRDHTMADLKKLDVGYGYTADGGQTFPLRGKGVGLMPALDEVLTAFPDKRFLINVKSNDASEGEKLAAHIAKLSPQSQARLMVYGGTNPLEAFHAQLPVDPSRLEQIAEELPGALSPARLVRRRAGRLPRRPDAGAAQRRAVAVGMAE